MILEQETFETFETFGYYPSKLSPKSNKSVLATCDDCGKPRTTTKGGHRSLCLSCAMKGKIFTEEHKALMSVAQKGKKNPMFGRTGKNNPNFNTHRTEETKALMSTIRKGKFKGNKNHNFKGGRKAANARHHAKRRQLGCTPLMPLAEGEIGHHFTDEDIIGIPAEVHERLSGYSRKKHRTLVLLWLKANDNKKYNKVLCVLAQQPL